MSIDWITVLAQIGNFLVLIWLLKRFLYRPVLDGIDAREAQISQRMGEAKRIRDMAESEKAQFAQRLANLESEQSGVLEKIRVDAEKDRSQIISQTHEQLAAQRLTAAKDQQAQANRFTAQLQKAGAQALLTLLHKALADLADQSLEEQLVIEAGRQIKSSIQELRAATGSTNVAVVITQETLSGEARKTLTSLAADQLAGIKLQFTTDPTQSPGLVMRIGGAQVSWTLDSYVKSLGQLIEDQISEKGHIKENG